MVSRRYLCCNSLIDDLEGIKESIDYLDQIIFEAWTFDGTRVTVIDEKKKELKETIDECIEILREEMRK